MSVTRREQTRRIAGLAMLTAIVIVLQLIGAFIKFSGFSVSLVLVPIVIGSALYGIGAGVLLGFAFGFTVLISGDASFFLTMSVHGTIITVLMKGILAGLFSALIYKALNKFNMYIAVLLSAIICPVINTGVFLIGCRVFFWDYVKQSASGINEEFFETFFFPDFIVDAIASLGNPIIIFALLGLGIINFVPELIFNVVMSPTIVKLINIVTTKIKK